MYTLDTSIISFRFRPWIYQILILLVIFSIASLPFIKTTIAIKSSGVIRPADERTEVKPLQTGHIDQLYVKEGDTVVRGQLIASIKDNSSAPKITLNVLEHQRRNAFVSDLKMLTVANDFKDLRLQTPLYKEQLNRFLHQTADHQSAIKKVSNELQIFSSLLKDKVIAPKEHFDKEIELERLQNNFKAFENEQLSIWQNDLQRYELDIAHFKSQQSQLTIEQKSYFIHAPVGGVIQNINTRYVGSFLSAGESLCIISPISQLLAECYLSTKDIGLMKLGQPTQFQIDAFDYNYFGLLTGKVVSIGNDFSIIDNKPVFKVHCSFDSSQLFLKNGFKANLKKGLSFQARFVIAERSLWQLLFDKVDDWFNPTKSMPS